MSGWTHAEAKRHTIIERLVERCATYSPHGGACINLGHIPRGEWCERCLAADIIQTLVGTPPPNPSTTEGEL